VLIEKYYGKDNLHRISNMTMYRDPVVLSIDEMNDDNILEALEKTPVFKRERDFNPRNYNVDAHSSNSLFD
jgi:cell division protein FtsZ